MLDIWGECCLQRKCCVVITLYRVNSLYLYAGCISGGFTVCAISFVSSQLLSGINYERTVNLLIHSYLSS